MIGSLLIANRGEIAVRIIRSCKELGIYTVAIYSEADRDSLHVRLADRAICIGPPPSQHSYLNVSNIVSAAVLSECDAVHPGVGFLAENSNFAQKILDSGLIFIGPNPEVIRLLGDKVAAKSTAVKYGVPVIPGIEGKLENIETAKKAADEIGYPIILKAAAGGGGKGMRIVRKPENLESTIQVATNEAEKSFSDGTLYMEKYLENPRHVEVQIIGDSFGNVIHLGERDCSIQRNHQKLIEESPSTIVDPEMREQMGQDAVRLFKGLNYTGAGTIEFLVQDQKYYFMEVNARVQVEHPVTEMITGIDIIKEQLRACSGEELHFKQSEVTLDGYAMECRVNALAPGTIKNYLPADGFNIRIDSFLYNGYFVPPFYDSLIAKVIIGAENRQEGIRRMLRVLDELELDGIATNIDQQKMVLNNKIFRSGSFGTDLYKTIMGER